MMKFTSAIVFAVGGIVSVGAYSFTPCNSRSNRHVSLHPRYYAHEMQYNKNNALMILCLVESGSEMSDVETFSSSAASNGPDSPNGRNDVNRDGSNEPQTAGDSIINTFNIKVSDSVELRRSGEEDFEVDLDALSQESAKQAFTSKLDLSSMEVKTPRRAPRQAKWFPMLLSPTGLDGTLAGDVGFDPLGFSGGSREGALRMREAEIKHARLAMLAAAGTTVVCGLVRGGWLTDVESMVRK